MVNTTKGSEIVDSMLMMQYLESPIYRQYLAAFVDEMDFLFAQLEEVYLGRFIELAIGTQLDIIGIILNESRSINLDIQFFGFSDNGVSTGIDKLADEAVPSDGGIFRSEGQSGGELSVLSDEAYRRVLLSKAFLSSVDECSINNAYHAISVLLGRTPDGMQLTNLADRQVKLDLLAADTTVADLQIISYFSQYLVPMGTSLTIIRT